MKDARRSLEHTALAGAFLLLASCGGSGSAQSTTDAATVDALPDDGAASARDARTDDAAAVTGTSCDGGVAEIAGGDGATSVEDAGAFFVTALLLTEGLCLPQKLPVVAPGQVDCQILYVLASGDACAAHSGLSEASADLAASVRARDGLDSSKAICVLAQLPLTDWVCGSCATSSVAGWCYVIGSAAGTCAQSLLASPTGAQPAGADALFACGAPPPVDGGAAPPR
jgi:hypothetical protein